MRYSIIIKFLLKAVLLILPLLMVSLLLKVTFSYSCKSGSCLEDYARMNKNLPTYYFIGTSRVQQSIDPEILKADLPDNNFLNLGITNNSFLYSCKVASNLMKEGPRKKIFIELTGLALPPSDSYYLLLHTTDVLDVLKQHLSIQCTTEDISGLLFYMFNIHSDLKKVVYASLDIYSRPEIGFMPNNRTYTGAMEGMLTPQSFAIIPPMDSTIPDAYLAIIDQLQKEAKETESEIQFILPLTIVNASEFDIDMSVFARLPDDMKWTYSTEFLHDMKKQQYLSDEYHLSYAGAVRYSHELATFIGTRFKDGK